MKDIQILSDRIEEEIKDAKTYAEWAIECKDTNPERAKKYYTISTQEMDHMKMLHEIVVDMIEDYRKEHGDPPPDMQAIYNHEHKKHIDAAGKVRALQLMFRE